MITAAFALCAAFGFGWAAKGAWVRENARFDARIAAAAAAERSAVLAAAGDVDGRRW